MPEKAPPALDKYDGSTDPDKHLRTFGNAMTFYTNSDPIMYKAFSLSLKEEALEWYNTLPPNTVDCFATIETLFRRQFATNRRQEITTKELVKTKEEKDETLKAFMKKYNEVARRVKNVNHTFIINNLPSCLRLRYFAEKLYARPPKTMDELLERIAEFIHMGDMRMSQRKQQQEADVGGKRRNDRQTFDDKDRGGGSRPKDLPRMPKFDHYTAIKTPRAKILEETLNAKLLSVMKLHSPKNVDGGRHCQYHQNLRHTTEECVTLKDKIESLIRAGHLRKCVKKDRRRIRSSSRYPQRSTKRPCRKEEWKYRRSRSCSHSSDRTIRGRID
ncbi:uncharacterized protein LOC124824968 [Vigna umbellata]|uniref:uncharacterized protein LOC124824968 n=1 Tax=Vigna umbellata TaxID=87088 RepID=UPI001F5E782E|nr:uncharacterized protein LOC124824968 [Vigna umbellata]